MDATFLTYLSSLFLIIFLAKLFQIMYREVFYFIDWFHCSALHGSQCTAGCEVYTNIANELACLTGDNVWNEVVTIYRSQEVLKMLCLYMQIFLAINCFVKNTGTTILLAPAAHQIPTVTGWNQDFVG
jgi:hypothetical protein